MKVQNENAIIQTSSLNEILMYPQTDGSQLMFPVSKIIYSVLQNNNFQQLLKTNTNYSRKI